MRRTVSVELPDRTYEVRIGAGLLGELGSCVSALGDVSLAVVIADSRVADLYGERAAASLRRAGLRAETIRFPPGEASKTLGTFGRLADRLFAIDPPVDRRTVIVALGGGVTGDLAGFLAACALRGLRLVQCPTTLLAAVDASVGGKTAVDHPAGKNLIGAFHQPRSVLIDVDALETLPGEALRGGLAECVKHAVIRDEALLAFLATRAGDILACDRGVLTELVAWNVSIKAAVVAADEREAGERAHLNFGHTIGHAIEACGGYDPAGPGHGPCVALGMVAENRIAVARGVLDAGAAGRVQQVLDRLGLPTRRKGLDPTAVWRIMQHDKKARGGQVRMVLPIALGRVEIFSDVTREEVAEALTALEPS